MSAPALIFCAYALSVFVVLWVWRRVKKMTGPL